MMGIGRKAFITRTFAGWLMAVAGGLHGLYYASGLLWGWEKDAWNLLQLPAGFGFAALGLWILAWRNRWFTGRSLLFLRIVQIAVGMFLLVFLAVEALIWSGGRTESARQADYLLILGARVKGETVTLSLRDRLEQGIDYLRRYPGTPVILSGGRGAGEDITEAEAMRRYLVERGVNPAGIWLEDRSTSTYENLLYTRRLLESKGINPQTATLTLITNDFHMLRSKVLAKRAGLTVFGLSAPTPPYTLPKAYTREFAALIKSCILDR